jgi:hypothetical protein
VDHPLDPTDTLVRPWRTAAYVAAAIAALELLVLLAMGGGALLHALSARLQLEAQQTVELSPDTTTERKARRATRSLASARAQLPRRKTTVLVLNGNGRTGAAAAAANRVSRRGYRIGRVGNASRTDFARSMVMFRPGFAGEGKRLGRDLGVRAVVPLDGMRPRDLGRAHVVYILGR